MNKEYKVVWHVDKKDCNCANWLIHWMNATKKKVFPKCSVAYCTYIARTGGHIVDCEDPHGEVYVIPLCREHDSSLFTDCFKVNHKVKLVNVIKLKNCDFEL
jgi:hypothetical protein